MPMTSSLRLGLSGVILGLTTGLAAAGTIERACLSSGRDAANRAICNCIQGVADQTLTSGDQRRAARFFRDPELAHRTRTSDSQRDDSFWQRWEDFGGNAELYCAA